MGRRIRKLYLLLSSRGFAFWMLAAVSGVLLLSAFLPSEFSMTEEEFERLRERPFVFALSERLSTPKIVSNPVFQFVSFFLAFSTLLCTVKRLRAASRRRDFSKRRAFSAAVRGEPGSHAARQALLGVLEERGWRYREEKGGRGVTVVHARKGEYGYWGSIIFHVSLILVFSGGALSSITRFNGEMVAPVGVEISTGPEAFVHTTGKVRMPDFPLMVKALSPRFEGRVPVGLDGLLILDGKEFEFGVNRPFSYNGYQFSPSRYGVSPRFVLRSGDAEVFGAYVNLRSIFSEDFFEVPGEGLRVAVRFFPDFYTEGRKFGTRTLNENNPVFYLKIYRDETLLASRLMKKGESFTFGGYELSIPDYVHWVGIVVSRDSGLAVFLVSFVLMLAGLGMRFLSNERQLSGLFFQDGSFELRGWSRYYPAFLEGEMQSIRREILGR